jgi:hypothetical protein
MLGDKPKSSWKGSYKMVNYKNQYIISQNNNIKYSKEFNILPNKKSVFKDILISTTIDSSKIYSIMITVDYKFFNSYKQCKKFMLKAAHKINEQYKDISYEEYKADNGRSLFQYYILKNLLNQNITFKCIANKKSKLVHNANIIYEDTYLNKQVEHRYQKLKVQYTKNLEREKKQNRQNSEDNSMKMF